jgi:hypothetical protein
MISRQASRSHSSCDAIESALGSGESGVGAIKHPFGVL